MEIHSKKGESGPVIAAVLALIVLGLGSLFLTWQSIKRQRLVVEDQMVQSGRVIVSGVEANLMRIMRGLRGSQVLSRAFPTLAKEFFQEIADSQEVLFVALLRPNGEIIISSDEGELDLENALPDQAFLTLESVGHWNGMFRMGGMSTLVVGRRARPGVARTCGMMPEGSLTPVPPDDRHGRNRDRHNPPPNPDDFPEPAIYFVVGLNAEPHLAQFHLYRRAALLQTGYVFGAAVVLWSLAFAYLRRRDQAQRVGRLERFQSRLLDNMPDGLVTLAPDGEVLAANGSAVRLMADDNDEQGLVGRDWHAYPFGDLGDTVEWKQHEFKGRRLEMLAVPCQDLSGLATGEDDWEERLILIRDRTKIKCLEEDLDEARRLATIGSLAAGVAHEVRNPLSSLRGFAQFFADKFKGKAPFEAYATTMVQEADRLNRVVTDLLFLARPRRLDPVQVDLQDMAKGIKRLMRFDLEHKQITPVLDIPERMILADPDALKQVLLNLLANSLDAVPEQGGVVRLSSHVGDGGVWVAVGDNGPGMPEDVRLKALEPFFTSKQKGTGLGLAIVNNIMRAHRGRVRIETAPEGGAEIRLFFPDPSRVDEQPDAEPAGSAPEADQDEEH